MDLIWSLPTEKREINKREITTTLCQHFQNSCKSEASLPKFKLLAALRFQKPGTLYSTGVSQCDIGATMKIWAQETKLAQKTGAEGKEWSEPWCKCKSKHKYYRCSLSSVLVEWELHSRHCSQWECSGKTIHTLRKGTFLFWISI